MILLLTGQLLAGPYADLAVLRLCWANRAHSADGRSAYWWIGLMLHAAVTAVRGMSFKPIHPLSGVYASETFERTS